MVCGKCSLTQYFIFEWCGFHKVGLAKFSMWSLAGVTVGQVPVSSVWAMGICLRKFGP